MFFLDKIRNQITFDLFGYGFNPIKDKWNGLAPYRYSLVVENYKGPYYWSEKLSDCFLARTMPIYYGCTNITDYFPKDSLVQININDLNIIDKIKKIISSDLWIRKREKIDQARKLILQRYQFFPYFTEQIHQHEKQNRGRVRKKEEISIPKEDTFWRRFKASIKQYL